MKNELGIDELVERIFHKKIDDSLSGKEKQKLAIFRTLLKGNASLFIFDEPVSSMDEKSISNLLIVLEKLKIDQIILIISHDKCFDSIVDEILIL